MAAKPVKPNKKSKISPLLILGGIAVVGIGGFLLYQRYFSGGSGFGSTSMGAPALPFMGQPGQNPWINPLINAPIPMGTAPSTPYIQPSLAQMQGGLQPFQQNQFCDPTLGLYWNPMTGQCTQNLAGSNGQCAPGSQWNGCQCQCVPQGVAQPQCYRDCASSCPDKINQVFSWCTLGCIPKSAAYGNPGLMACPPLQGSSTSVQYNLTAGGQPGVPGGLNRLNVAGQQIGVAPAVS